MHGDNQGDVREICTAGIDKYGKNWEVSSNCVASSGCLLSQLRRSAQLTHMTQLPCDRRPARTWPATSLPLHRASFAFPPPTPHPRCLSLCRLFLSRSLSLPRRRWQNAAKHIKEQLDKKYGNQWHVCIGEGYSYSISHNAQNMMHIYYGEQGLGVLVFRV